MGQGVAHALTPLRGLGRLGAHLISLPTSHFIGGSEYVKILEILVIYNWIMRLLHGPIYNGIRRLLHGQKF